MRTIRLLTLLAFVLAITVTGARASGGTVGFMPLLTHADKNASIEAQSGLAFDRLLPRLLSLQHSGIVTGFEPSFPAGIVKVKYSGAYGLADLLGMPVYADVHAALAVVPATKTAEPGRATVGGTSIAPWFKMWLYDDCFYAEGLGASSHVVGKLYDKTLRLVATYQGDADSSGIINSDCFSWNGSYSNVMPGYKVSFKVYSNSSLTTLRGGPYSAVAPAIKFTTVTNSTGVIAGTGPAGKAYSAYWEHRNLNAANTWTSSYIEGTVGGAGTWSQDMTGNSFRGGDWISVRMQQTPVITFSRGMYVPYIYCQLGSNYCDLRGFAFQAATLSITHGATTYTKSGNFSASGYFWAETTNNGDPVFLAAGDKASGTSVALFTLPSLTAAVNFSTDVVSGKAPAGKYLDVWTNIPYLSKSTWYGVYTRSNSLGAYSADFTSQVDLMATRGVNAWVTYKAPSTGNVTDYANSISP